MRPPWRGRAARSRLSDPNARTSARLVARSCAAPSHRRTFRSIAGRCPERSRFMSHSNAQRMTVVAGVLFVVLSVIGFVAFTRSGYPDSNDPARKIAAYFVQHRDAALWQQFILGLGSLAGLVFVAGVVSMMWRSEASRPLAIVAGVGGAGAIAMFLVGSGLLTLLAYRPEVGDPGLMRAELDGGYIMFNASGFMLAAFVGSASIAAWRQHVLPAWVGELGMAVAVLQLVGAAAYSTGDGAFSPMGWVPLLAALSMMVWTLCVCFAVWRP